jgi:hypothetical protein
MTRWLRRCDIVVKSDSNHLVYEHAGQGAETLLRNAEDVASGRTAAPFTVANSMREVQPEINILISPIADNLPYREPEDAPPWEPQPTPPQATSRKGD